MDFESTATSPSVNNTRLLANMGKVWHDDEVLQLLQNIKKKKTIHEIAEIHQRTTVAISSRLARLAADYHDEGRPLEQIQKFTGLTQAEISDSIKRRRVGAIIREKRQKDREASKALDTTNSYKQKQITSFVDQQPTMRELMAVLKDVQAKLNTILERK
jgi:hypothetical protein